MVKLTPIENNVNNPIQLGGIKLTPIDDDYSSIPIKKQKDNLLDKISGYLPRTPTGLNMASGIMSLITNNPEQRQMLSNIPQIMLGQQPTIGEKLEHVAGQVLPSFAMPEARGGSDILNALSRVGGQSGFGASTNKNPIEGAKEFGGLQTLIEGIGAAPRIAGKIAELMNPIKYAGKTAEEIRNYAQEGLKEGEKYYKPVHEKYDENWVTTTPKKYLGFHPEDTQYFKPEVNRALRDFYAEPTFKNLHELQSIMGKYPELYPLRESVKNKAQSFLSHDLPILESYMKGSDVLKEKYYPYIANDTMKGITEHEKTIENFNVQELIKALKNSPIVDKAEKSAKPILHPLVNLSKNLQDLANRGHAMQYILPTALGGIGGHYIDPTLGTLSGSIAGSIFSKYAEPQLLKLSQNPWLINILKSSNEILKGLGREGVGYYNSKKQ